MNDKEIVFELVEPYEVEELAAVTGVPDDVTNGALGKLIHRMAIGTEDTKILIMLAYVPERASYKDAGLYKWKGHYLLIFDKVEGMKKPYVIHYPDLDDKTARWFAAILLHMALRADPDRKDELAEYNRKIGAIEGPLFDFDENDNPIPRFQVPATPGE